MDPLLLYSREIEIKNIFPISTGTETLKDGIIDLKYKDIANKEVLNKSLKYKFELKTPSRNYLTFQNAFSITIENFPDFKEFSDKFKLSLENKIKQEVMAVALQNSTLKKDLSYNSISFVRHGIYDLNTLELTPAGIEDMGYLAENLSYFLRGLDDLMILYGPAKRVEHSANILFDYLSKKMKNVTQKVLTTLDEENYSISEEFLDSVDELAGEYSNIILVTHQPVIRERASQIIPISTIKTAFWNGQPEISTGSAISYFPKTGEMKMLPLKKEELQALNLIDKAKTEQKKKRRKKHQDQLVLGLEE